MTSDEIRLIELIVRAVKGTILGHAGLLENKEFTAHCFEQCEEIDSAMSGVKEQANARLDRSETAGGKDCHE